MNLIRILVLSLLSSIAFNSAVAQNPTFQLAIGGPGVESGIKIIADDNGYVAVGSVFQPSGYIDLFFTKVGLAGNVIWKRILSDTVMHATDIIRTADKGFAMSGYGLGGTVQLPFIIKTDSNGVIIWCHSFGHLSSDDFINSISETSDGGIIAVGSTEIATQHHCPWLIKTDHSGTSVGLKSLISMGQKDMAEMLLPLLMATVLWLQMLVILEVPVLLKRMRMGIFFG